MSQNEIVKPDTKKQDEEVEETKEETQEETETESNEDESSSSTNEKEDSVDYKALLQTEKERTEKAERALAENRYIASKKKREEPIEDEISSDDEEDKPLTKKDLQTLLQKERQNTQKAFEESRALDIARKNTASEDEAQAAILFWKNRVVPTGNIEEDINFAIGGLNSRKTLARNAELVRALRSRDGIINDSSTTHRDSSVGSIPKLSSGDSLAYKRAGFAYDSNSKTWKKKLPNGKFLIKDPRTKQTKVI